MAYYVITGNSRSQAMSADDLKMMAEMGQISAEDIIELPDGKRVPAGKIRDLFKRREPQVVPDPIVIPQVAPAPTTKTIHPSDDFGQVDYSWLHELQRNLKNRPVYYHEGSVRLGPVSVNQLPTLAERGSITPGTLFETADGRKFYSKDAAIILSASVKSPKNRLVAALLHIFLRGIGCGYFYLGHNFSGVVSVLLCWTPIPYVIGIIEGIRVLVTDENAFHAKYG